LVVGQAQDPVGETIDPVDVAAQRGGVELEPEALLDREHLADEARRNLALVVVAEHALEVATLLLGERSWVDVVEGVLGGELEQALERLWLVPLGVVEGLDDVVEDAAKP